MAERVEDLNLPNAVVTRIIKECLPDGINVSKEARTAIARATSIYILFITSAANNVATQASRKTISANDVFKALEETEFSSFVKPIQEALEEFKKLQLDKKQKAAGKKGEDIDKSSEDKPNDETMEEEEQDDEDEQEQ
ncbi:DNA polymerase epsilon subunit 3 Chrac-14 [Rhodnius prolixus]|uniref:DNA polymerase epsilon subunit 3 n=1 Tax=Rhodnius prolixus TaxID=13249 RepID=R4G7W2_RHOPR